MCIGNNCTDPIINSLKDINYNAVRLPKPDIRPLELLTRKGTTFTRIGGMNKLFAARTQSLPSISANNPVPEVSGKRSHDMNVGLGLSILGPIIKAMGGNLGLDVAYKNAKTVTFEFADVHSDSVEMIDVDLFLGDADVNPHAVAVGQMLDADEVFVITDVIASTKLSVDAKDDGGQSVKLDVPVVQQIVGGNVAVAANGSSSSTITYEGKVPLVFGFKAVHLFYDKGKYETLKPAPVSDGVLGLTAVVGHAGTTPSKRVLLRTGAAFIDVTEASQ